jgi:hypothetical protein
MAAKTGPADAKADAMKALYDRILSYTAPGLRAMAEAMLADLLALYGGDELDEETTAAVIARALSLARPEPEDTADDPAAQNTRDWLMLACCGECGTEAHADGTPPAPEEHLSSCPRYQNPRWEVSFSGISVIEADSAERAAIRAAAEDEYETGDRYYQPDPNPYAWVRLKGSSGSWQQVSLDDLEAIAAEVAVIEDEES